MADTLIEHPIINKLLEQFVQRLAKAFEKTVQREGLISTGELLNSIRAEGVKYGSNFISAHVSYSDLLRVKDMDQLTYTTIPPLAPLADWVERTGVDKFAYVPGFKQGEQSASEIHNIYRIASGIRYHLRASPNIRRGYRGIYNDPMKNKLLPDFYDEMRAAIRAAAKESFYKAFGYDVAIDMPDGEINASRIQAAWNAWDTKLARKYASASDSMAQKTK
jgi:hypothetical protein